MLNNRTDHCIWLVLFSFVCFMASWLESFHYLFHFYNRIKRQQSLNCRNFRNETVTMQCKTSTFCEAWIMYAQTLWSSLRWGAYKFLQTMVFSALVSHFLRFLRRRLWKHQLNSREENVPVPVTLNKTGKTGKTGVLLPPVKTRSMH